MDEGISCELEMLDFLSKKNFKNIPQLEGKVTYTTQNGNFFSLGLATKYFPHSQDGWNYFLTNPSLSLFKELGKATGQMHQLFPPSQINNLDKEKWFTRFKELLTNLNNGLKKNKSQFVDLQKKLNLIFYNQDLMLSKAKSLLDSAPLSAFKIRCHGDYHLGQTLLAEKEWVILDFEGEPMRSLEERKEEYPAAKDVAGMLRSIDYLAYTLMSENKVSKDKIKEWKKTAKKNYLEGYESETKKTSSSKELLKFFELDKLVYELNYELNNRPDWLKVPLNGFEELIPNL